MMSPTGTGPLEGVTVLDLCSYLAGPYGCTLLADLGAAVIKIESPQGGMQRQFPSSLPGESRFFLGTNPGKRAFRLAALHLAPRAPKEEVGTAEYSPAGGRPCGDGIDCPPPVFLLASAASISQRVCRAFRNAELSDFEKVAWTPRKTTSRF